eukprot:CAMPEP_0119312936 /NCGR_PEP_ID=MMETSP1333-20130426/27285_1 /TAXON_ID=418940 /ORGANISM="Scyphosphaera apsteinii, Strain RCC1455" /LENGTH=384 /DNA_ID=CAMNT_0007317639 /DNA_START=36 /DNA_END=1190 /DNA_ORIENTATION=+
MVLLFSIRSGDVQLKISLDEKWQRKPFLQAVVEPFLKAYNKKNPKMPLKADGLRSVLVDGVEGITSSGFKTLAVVNEATQCVELSFGEPLPKKLQFGVRCQQVELKITLEAPWVQRSFLQAVVEPFVLQYNKRTTKVPIAADDLQCVLVDDDEVSELSRPAWSVVPVGAKQVELFFGRKPPPSHGTLKEVSDDEFFLKVHTKAGEVKAKQELAWNTWKLGPAEAVAMARVLTSAGPLSQLERLFLHNNDLRCQGLALLASCMTQDRFPNLNDLHLHGNRIGDDGVRALAEVNIRFRTLMLHTNCIGDEGCKILAINIDPPREPRPEGEGEEDDDEDDLDHTGKTVCKFYAKCIYFHANSYTAEGRKVLEQACLGRFLDIKFDLA